MAVQPDELLRLARKGKLDQLESAWMGAVADEALDPAVSEQIVSVVVNRGHVELAESLLWYLLDSLAEAGRTGRALEVAAKAAPLLPHSATLRQLLADLYLKTHADDAQSESLVPVTLGDAALPLGEALAALERLRTLRPGTYVLDPNTGAVGRVDGLDAERGGLGVTFEDGPRVYGAALAGRLEPLEDDDFRALCAFHREQLCALAEQDPEELMRLVLTSLDRRMELRRLRLYLDPIVGSWPRWWSRTKPILQKSAVTGVTEGQSPSVFLRSRPLTHGDRLLRRFDACAEPLPKLALALRVAEEADEHPELAPGALQHVLDAVGRVAAASPGSAEMLAARAVADAVGRRLAGPTEPAASAVHGEQGFPCAPEELAAAIGDTALLLCVVDYLRRRSPTAWAEFSVALMPLVPRDVCTEVARRLAEDHADEALAEACSAVLGDPEVHVGALAWLWRDCVSATGRTAAAHLDRAAVAAQLLSRLLATVRAPDMPEDKRKARIAEARSALFVRDGAPLREVLRAASREQVATVKSLGEQNPGLTERMQADLSMMLREAQPELFAKAVPPWAEGVVYTTPSGMAKKQAELEHIAHVRLPQVMREIGEAAGFGDVSDNAEFRSAVHERARLAERAAHIQQELAGARLITREMAATDHVTVGSRVRARNAATGEETTLTFMGPWDAEPEANVCAYNAPLGRAFMGKRVGDVVTYRMDAEERRWEVLEVGPAL